MTRAVLTESLIVHARVGHYRWRSSNDSYIYSSHFGMLQPRDHNKTRHELWTLNRNPGKHVTLSPSALMPEHYTLHALRAWNAPHSSSINDYLLNHFVVCYPMLAPSKHACIHAMRPSSSLDDVGTVVTRGAMHSVSEAVSGSGHV